MPIFVIESTFFIKDNLLELFILKNIEFHESIFLFLEIVMKYISENIQDASLTLKYHSIFEKKKLIDRKIMIDVLSIILNMFKSTHALILF